MKRIILISTSCGLAVVIFFAQSASLFGQTYSRTVEIRTLEAQAQRHCDAAKRIFIAEEEANADGRTNDVETFNFAREKELAQCREKLDLIAKKKALLAEEIRRAEGERIER